VAGALGNRAFGVVVARRGRRGLARQSSGIDVPQRSAQDREDLIEDAFQAVVQNETEGTPVESHLHTAAGVSASFRNATQMIAQRAVGELKNLSAADRAKFTTLTARELTTAQQVMTAAGQVWDRIVAKKEFSTPEEARVQIAPLLATARLYEDSDLQRMFAFQAFEQELEAAKTSTLPQRQEELKQLSDQDLLGRTTPSERPRSSKLTGRQRENLIRTISEREVFDEIASHEPGLSLDMRVRDVRTYFQGGHLGVFGEDRAACQRLAIGRAPIKGGPSDELESRVRAAVEAGGGFRLSRFTFHKHLSNFLTKHPDASDDDVASEAAFHNFVNNKTSGAKAYTKRILGFSPKSVRHGDKDTLSIAARSQRLRGPHRPRRRPWCQRLRPPHRPGHRPS
jgi:hypothetical protein